MNYKINLYVEDKDGKKVEDVVKEISVNNQLTASLIKQIVNEDKYLPGVVASEKVYCFGDLKDTDKATRPFVQYTIKLK